MEDLARLAKPQVFQCCPFNMLSWKNPESELAEEGPPNELSEETVIQAV